jgi:hypothetical protein
VCGRYFSFFSFFSFTSMIKHLKLSTSSSGVRQVSLSSL